MPDLTIEVPREPERLDVMLRISDGNYRIPAEHHLPLIARAVLDAMTPEQRAEVLPRFEAVVTDLRESVAHLQTRRDQWRACAERAEAERDGWKTRAEEAERLMYDRQQRVRDALESLREAVELRPNCTLIGDAVEDTLAEIVRMRARVGELAAGLRPFAEREDEARTGDVFDRAANGLGVHRQHFVRARALLAEASDEG